MKEILKRNQFIIVFFVFITLSACGGNQVVPSTTSTASSTTDAPQNKRTDLGLYLTSADTFKLLSTEEERKKTLFIDVRTEEEYDNGTPTLVDDNVPMYNYDENKKYVANPDYLTDVADYLEGKGLNKESRIILICHEGNRSTRAVNALAKEGYKNVHNVIDGTEGWRSNKLPWLE